MNVIKSQRQKEYSRQSYLFRRIVSINDGRTDNLSIISNSKKLLPSPLSFQMIVTTTARIPARAISLIPSSKYLFGRKKMNVRRQLFLVSPLKQFKNVKAKYINQAQGKTYSQVCNKQTWMVFGFSQGIANEVFNSIIKDLHTKITNNQKVFQEKYCDNKDFIQQIYQGLIWINENIQQSPEKVKQILRLIKGPGMNKLSIKDLHQLRRRFSQLPNDLQIGYHTTNWLQFLTELYINVKIIKQKKDKWTQNDIIIFCQTFLKRFFGGQIVQASPEDLKKSTHLFFICQDSQISTAVGRGAGSHHGGLKYQVLVGQNNHGIDELKLRKLK